MNIETANKLLQYRKASGLSQEELAEKIGVSRQAVSKWERAEASPDTDNLILLAKIYGVTLDELLIGDPATTLNKEKEDNSQNSTPDDNSEEVNNQQKKQKAGVSFKNGIHIHDGEDKVDISFKDGIHVESKDGTKVSVDKDGVNVVDEDGNVKAFTDEHGHIHHDCEESSAHRKAKLFPFWAIALTGFFAFGFINIFGGWATSWLWFLTIPMYYTAVDAIFKKKISHFAYPVFVVWLFCFLGMTCGLWHPLWLIFLTIPLYYYIAGLIDKKNGNIEDNDRENFTQDGFDVNVTDKPKARKTSTIVLFIICAVIIVFLGTCGLAILFGDTETISKTYQLDDNFTDNIRLDNASGDVTFHTGEEYSHIEYTQTYRGLFLGNKSKDLVINQENDTTEIDHDNWFFQLGYSQEKIDIYLAEKDYESLYIDTASGSIDLGSLVCDSIEIDSSSGTITGRKLTADTLTVDSASGDIYLDGNFKTAGFDVSSGNVQLKNGILPDKIDIDSSSGDIEIYLPYYKDDEKSNEESGFTVNYSKASGDINSEFPVQGAFDSGDGKAIYGNGKSEITVDIASGDVEIKKNKLMSTN